MPGQASRCRARNSLGKLPPEHTPGRPQPNLPACKELITSHDFKVNRQLELLGSTPPSTVLGGKSYHHFWVFWFPTKGGVS